jgi:hypothetical protein
MKLDGKAVADKIKDVYKNAGDTFIPPVVARAMALKELATGEKAVRTKKKRGRKAKAKAT